MQPSDPPADAGIDLFRRLLDATIAATLLLILVGGIVRVSDSGLGCGPAGSGTHGWPLCEGGLIPVLEGPTAVEFTHRVVAGLVGVLAVALVLVAWRRLSGETTLPRIASAALGLVLAQAALGGLTVEHDLEAVLVAAHLGLAMLFLGLLLLMRRRSAGSRDIVDPAAASGAPRTLSLVAAGLVLATIIAGGYVAGTEGEGTAEEPVLGAHLACGKQFPTCLDKVAPFGTSDLVDAQLTHRALMLATVIAALTLAAVALRRGARSRWLVVMLILLAGQVLLGALNVWLGKHAGLIVGHLALGTLLWVSAVETALTLRGETSGQTMVAPPGDAVTA